MNARTRILLIAVSAVCLLLIVNALFTESLCNSKASELTAENEKVSAEAQAKIEELSRAIYERDLEISQLQHKLEAANKIFQEPNGQPFPTQRDPPPLTNEPVGRMTTPPQAHTQAAMESAVSKDTRWFQEHTAVIVFCYNRPNYLDRTLQSILRHRPQGNSIYPIYVSQDGADVATADLIDKFASEMPFIHHLTHTREIPALRGENPSYYAIAAHYKFGLDALINQEGFDNVLILEEDLEIAPDFFAYFEATYRILQLDPTLWTVSAWNDNGRKPHVRDPQQLYRSDFFPGLGWIMTKKLWAELGPKWPAGYWDDWMREPEQRQGRVCLRPEISRTHTFGEIGSSSGEFYKTHLVYNELEAEPVDWPSVDLNYLIPEVYDSQLWSRIEAAELYSSVADLPPYLTGDGKLAYANEREFSMFARGLQLMEDFKAGVPRTAYQGVVSIRRGDYMLFIVPLDRIRAD
eukprot:Rmarinus@m.28956